jgi:hypothetical protein
MASFTFTARADVIRQIALDLEGAVAGVGDSRVITVTIDDATANTYTTTDSNGKKRFH